MEHTGRRDGSRPGTDEQRQSSVFVALTAAVFTAFLIFFTFAAWVPAARAGNVTLYRGEGSALFAKGRAELIHAEVLRDTMERLNNDLAITGLEISVTCPLKGGGKKLAGKRCESLARFFKLHLRRPLPVKKIAGEQMAIPGYTSEDILKMVQQIGSTLSESDKAYVNYWDVVVLTGIGGASLSSDPIIYEIDQKLKKLPAGDPHIAMLRRYRKIVLTIVDLNEELPPFIGGHEEISAFPPNPPYAPSPEYGFEIWIVGGFLQVARYDYAEYTEKHLPLAVMAVKLAREVHEVAMAIHREHPLAHVPPYDEENGRNYLRAQHTLIRTTKDAINAARLAYQALVRRERVPCSIKEATMYTVGSLQETAHMTTYQIRRRFGQEQVALNNFIREHLGLSLMTNDCQAPIYNLIVPAPATTGDVSGGTFVIRYMTMEESEEGRRRARHKWAECGFPSVEELRGQEDAGPRPDPGE